jgi:hypothetical protein
VSEVRYVGGVVFWPRDLPDQWRIVLDQREAALVEIGHDVACRCRECGPHHKRIADLRQKLGMSVR